MEEESKKSPEKMRGKMTPEELKRIEGGVKRAEKLAEILDDYYLDPIIGLLEGTGDAATALAGLYIVYEARQAHMPKWELAKMLGRQAIDFLIGEIPVGGDLFDFVYKSNKKNAAVLRKHFEDIRQNADMTEEMEEDLAESDRSKELKDLKGLKEKVSTKKGKVIPFRLPKKGESIEAMKKAA
jgi:Domain of unknown function (DUF4112)